MKKLDIYISKNFIKSFMLSLIAFVNIFILSQLFKVIRYITEGKMEVSQAGLYIMYLLPKIFIEVTPLAILLGALMCINKMATNLEIISLKTSGISFKRIVRYPIIISVLISLVVFYVTDKINPIAVEKSRAMRRGHQVKIRNLPITKNNAFLRTDDNYVYYTSEIDREKNTAKLVEIIKLNNEFDLIEKIIVAKKGNYNLEKNMWELSDVVVNDLLLKSQDKYEIYIDEKIDEKPENFIAIIIDPDELTNKQIKKSIIEISMTGGDIKEMLSVLGQRYSFPFASFIVSFLGLSLGSRYVRGASAISIALSVGLGYFYYIVQSTFEALSINGMLNPFISGWIPNVLFLCLGLYFMKRAEY